MTILPSSRDYTDKDYEAIRRRTFSLIRSVFPTWSNDAVTNFGNILVESFGWILDILTFYQDQQAREGRFGTLVLRRSMINLCKLIGYVLPGAVAATADVVVTVTNAQALTGTIVPASPSVPVVVKTEAITNPIRGEIISPLPFSILATEISKTFQWEHSLKQPRFMVSSSGLADQRYFLPSIPFLDDGSEVVQTLSQGVFTRVTSFFSSDPSDVHYRIQIDQNDRAEVLFGDGTNGAIPVGMINVDYRTGGGIWGNVEQGGLTKVEGSFVDSVGRPAYLIATNPVEAEGGLPRQEVEAARVYAPLSIRVPVATVAREDYEINALRVPGVGRALMLTSNESEGIGENRGDLYIVPATGGTPSQTMLDSVLYMCTIQYPNTITFQLAVKPANYLTVNIRVVIYLRQGSLPATVKASIQAAMADYFAPTLASGAPNPEIDFGYNYKDAQGNPAGELAWSDLENIVRDTTGVRKVDSGTEGFTLNGLRSDLPIPNWQFPKLGDVVVVNGDTGTEI